MRAQSCTMRRVREGNRIWPIDAHHAVSTLPGVRLCSAAFTCLPPRRPASAFETERATICWWCCANRSGENKQDESLQPFGKLRATMADGREIELETSWYQYLGDMHIRLVFDGAQTLQSASPEDLSRLRLSPDEA